MTETLVLIPVYNEESSVQAVLTKLRRYHFDDVLVINDGSTDRSPQILEQAVDPAMVVISHPVNQGYGSSLIDGFQYAQENGYRAVATIDCDLQHDPVHIPELLGELEQVDIVSGSRYLSKNCSDDHAPPDRLQINQAITAKINSLTSFGITDAFCGLKAYRVAALERLTLDQSGYGLPLQLWVQAAARELTIKEIPVARIYAHLNRSFGEELDNPETRLAYYERIIEKEARKWELM